MCRFFILLKQLSLVYHLKVQPNQDNTNLRCGSCSFLKCRLGPFGVVEIAVQGSWEKLRNGQAGIVSFDTFMVRPREVLGTRFGDDLPSVSLSLPQALQQIAEWEVWYLDETLRINQGRQGQLFIFTKKS